MINIPPFCFARRISRDAILPPYPGVKWRTIDFGQDNYIIRIISKDNYQSNVAPFYPHNRVKMANKSAIDFGFFNVTLFFSKCVDVKVKWQRNTVGNWVFADSISSWNVNAPAIGGGLSLCTNQPWKMAAFINLMAFTLIRITPSRTQSKRKRARFLHNEANMQIVIHPHTGFSLHCFK